jgi:hypothetical protein
MPQESLPKKRPISPDWLVQGVLTKIGDIFDKLTGRSWKPSSSLATSELIERLKKLLDAEVRENGDKRKFVPHNIKLKMQWDKFSTDSEGALKKLENELLIAAVDHINERHYYTHAPLAIQVKPDYFTSGVKLFVGFEKSDEDEAEVNVTIPDAKVADLIPAGEPEKLAERIAVMFSSNGKDARREIDFVQGTRISVGRTKENDIAIDDASVSKIHASLMLNGQGKLVVADTGSTNGTFIKGERISYGKAVEVPMESGVMFGLVNVSFERMLKPEEPVADPDKTEAYKVGEFEFTSKVAQPRMTEQGFSVENEEK